MTTRDGGRRRVSPSALAQGMPERVLRIVRRFESRGHRCYVVGGAVRDLLLGRDPTEFDLATDALPDRVRRLFPRVVPTGIRHGTVTVLDGDAFCEVTTFRTDGAYSDHRRPDNVRFSETIEEDLARRDFTINALAYSPSEDRLVDLHGGLEDLSRGWVRCIGEADVRFREDALRMLRALRFAVQLGFSVVPETLEAVRRNRDLLRAVSAERIRDECTKILAAPTPSVGFELARQTGLLGMFLPELEACHGVEQNRYHRYDVYFHSLYSCDAAPAALPRVRLAALLHDIGKPVSKRDLSAEDPDGEGKFVFYNHEVVGARMARRILRRLCFPGETVEQVAHIVRMHMFHYQDEWTDGAVRRFMRNAGMENLEEIFAMRTADRIGNGKKRGESRAMDRLRARIAAIVAAENAISLKDLAVDGNELMKELGLGEGPIVGRLLRHLLEIILDDPAKNERGSLLEAAREELARSGAAGPPLAPGEEETRSEG